MLQIVYISTATGQVGPSMRQAILQVSRENNTRDAITGLLYSDEKRFLQVLEGPDEKVRAALERIRADPRHRALVLLSTREVEAREFGDWAMASRTPGADSEAFIDRIDQLTRAASPNVRATFQSFAEVRRAA